VLIRVFFWGIIFIVANNWIVKKSKMVNKKKLSIIAFALCMILASVSSLFPVENLLISFEKPEDVLKYSSNIRVLDTEEFVYGNDSCMLVYLKKYESGHSIIPKSTDGYKIPSLFSVRRTLQKIDDDGMFDVYNVVGTSDYYVIGRISSTEEVSIVDSNDYAVRFIDIWMNEEYSVILFGFIEHFTYDYYLVINGEIVELVQKDF